MLRLQMNETLVLLRDSQAEGRQRKNCGSFLQVEQRGRPHLQGRKAQTSSEFPRGASGMGGNGWARGHFHRPTVALGNAGGCGPEKGR